MKNKHKLFESYRISDYPGFNEKQTQTIRILSNIRLPRIQWKINTNYSNRIEYQITQDSTEKQSQTIRILSNIRLPMIQWKTNTNYSNRIDYRITKDSTKNKHKLFESYRISDYPGYIDKQTQTIRIV